MADQTHLDDIGKKVKKVLNSVLNKDVDDLTQDKKLTDLNVDSLDMVEIIMAIEDEFNIEIPDSDAESMQTFGDLVGYVVSKSAS